jgi:hypothetical protein
MPHVHKQAAPSELVATDDRERLAKRGADPLASFIVSLAHDSSGVGDLVRAYIALDIPKASARIVRDSVERLRKSERDYDYRHRRGSEFVRRVGYVLDAIETIVLPAAPTDAFEILALLIESDGEISANCFEDDFGASKAFGRACMLLLAAAKHLPAEHTQGVLARLSARDDFGLRYRSTEIT